jgi:hypothetical protein
MDDAWNIEPRLQVAATLESLSRELPKESRAAIASEKKP